MATQGSPPTPSQESAEASPVSKKRPKLAKHDSTGSSFADSEDRSSAERVRPSQIFDASSPKKQKLDDEIRIDVSLLTAQSPDQAHEIRSAFLKHLREWQFLVLSKDSDLEGEDEDEEPFKQKRIAWELAETEPEKFLMRPMEQSEAEEVE
jgi:hypothetical protein